MINRSAVPIFNGFFFLHFSRLRFFRTRCLFLMGAELGNIGFSSSRSSNYLAVWIVAVFADKMLWSQTTYGSFHHQFESYAVSCDGAVLCGHWPGWVKWLISASSIPAFRWWIFRIFVFRESHDANPLLILPYFFPWFCLFAIFFP